MRESDWSSDVCSSDLDGTPREEKSPPGYSREPPSDDDDTPLAFDDDAVKDVSRVQYLRKDNGVAPAQSGAHIDSDVQRSQERRQND